MKYEVTVTRIGCVYVEADSSDEAMDIANEQPTENVDWCDEWEATDCVEDELPDLYEKYFGYIKRS